MTVRFCPVRDYVVTALLSLYKMSPSSSLGKFAVGFPFNSWPALRSPSSAESISKANATTDCSKSPADGSTTESTFDKEEQDAEAGRDKR